MSRRILVAGRLGPEHAVGSIDRNGTAIVVHVPTPRLARQGTLGSRRATSSLLFQLLDLHRNLNREASHG